MLFQTLLILEQKMFCRSFHTSHISSFSIPQDGRKLSIMQSEVPSCRGITIISTVSKKYYILLHIKDKQKIYKTNWREQSSTMPFSVLQCLHQQNNLNYDYLVQNYMNSTVFTDHTFIKLWGLNWFMQSTSIHVLKKGIIHTSVCFLGI